MSAAILSRSTFVGQAFTVRSQTARAQTVRPVLALKAGIASRPLTAKAVPRSAVVAQAKGKSSAAPPAYDDRAGLLFDKISIEALAAGGLAAGSVFVLIIISYLTT